MSNQDSIFYKRNLAVPFFTQRDNTYIWQQIDIDSNLKKGYNKKGTQLKGALSYQETSSHFNAKKSHSILFLLPK